ncbi:MAG: hypothetical protein B2I17_07725 [Thermoplasmatales archaeon B_DKE]|nr:MAG: hypothetical protein B2I17_07725 [Thermoplasmatales archaeon B_DKE]
MNLNTRKMVFSSAFFALGWFSLSFSFPLLAIRYNFDYTMTGFLGFLVAYPFVIAALINIYVKDRTMNLQIILIPFIMSLLAIVFVFQSLGFIVILIAVTDLLEAFYWVSMEMLLGSGGENLEAEKYSTAWGVPSAIMPLAAGIIIQSLGFRILFFVSFIFLLAGSFFRPKYKTIFKESKRNEFDFRFIVPMIFNGVAAGFVSYVLVPILRIQGVSYVLIGLAVTILGVSSAVGFVIMNFTGKIRINSISSISCLLLALPLFVGLTGNLIPILLVLVGTGIGSSIAFSKILAYISDRSSARKGVLTYEGFFAMGFVLGSLALGAAFQAFGKISFIIAFAIPAVYAIYLLFAQD